MKNPGSLEQTQDAKDSTRSNSLPEGADVLRAQRQKLRHGVERLIDGLAEGLIDKEQFTSRMNRSKARLEDLDAKIASQAADADRRAHIRSAMNRLTELSTHLQSQLRNAEWGAKRDIIRAVVQRIEIGPAKVAVVLRIPSEKGVRGLEPILVTLSRV